MRDNREILVKVFKMINDLKPYSNKDIRNVVYQLREFIRYRTYVDPYSARSHWPSWENKKGKIAVEKGTMNSHYSLYIKADTVWADNYVKWLRDPEKVMLHDKRNEFRIGDNFYKNDEYFEYNGKAYNKDEYVMYCDEPRKKSEVCLCYYHRWPSGGGNAKKYEIALMPESGESFVRHHTEDNAVVELHIDVSSYNGKLLCSEFVKSMFLVGNEREEPIYGDIYLTKEQLKQFKFKPTLAHLREFMKANNYYTDNIASQAMLQELEKAKFYIKLPNGGVKSLSLKQKLINIIIKRGRRGYADSCTGLKEFFVRLRAIKKMYEVEAQYAR